MILHDIASAVNMVIGLELSFGIGFAVLFGIGSGNSFFVWNFDWLCFIENGIRLTLWDCECVMVVDGID